MVNFIDFDDFHSESILTNTYYTADLTICFLKSYVQNVNKWNLCIAIQKFLQHPLTILNGAKPARDAVTCSW